VKIKLFLICVLALFIVKSNGQDHNISNGNIFDGEPYIAVNPNNHNTIVVAWMGYVYNNGSGLTIKIKSSFNGGLTWSSAVNMPHMVPTYKSADPSMAFDGNDNLFLSYIDYRESPDSGGVYLFKSTNGGLTWGSPVKMIDMNTDGSKKPIDRPWLVVNNAGDKLYLSTKPAPWVAAPNRPYFTASIDSGLTWQPWRYLDTANYLVGNVIAQPMPAPVCFGNTFYAMYPSYLTSQNVYPQFFLATTTNNGAHFSYNTFVNTQTAASNDSAKLAYKLIQDPTNSNHLAFIYPSAPFGDIDIMMIETSNAGTSWSSPLRINNDVQGNGKMQDMLWADFDTDGDMIVTWRDRRNASGSGFATASEFYAAFRDKDSSAFSPNIILSDSLVSYNAILMQSGNDFMSTVLRNDTLYSVYANTKDGSLDVWFVKTAARNGTTTHVSLLEGKSSRLITSPNPSSGIINIKVEDGSMIDEIKAFNANGEVVFVKTLRTATVVVDLSEQPGGIYTLVTKANGHIFSQKIVLSK
jgi:hypothetical protein